MKRPLLNRRLDGLGTTIFAGMSARALAGRTKVRFAFCERPEILEEALNRLTVLKGS